MDIEVPNLKKVNLLKAVIHRSALGVDPLLDKLKKDYFASVANEAEDFRRMLKSSKVMTNRLIEEVLDNEPLKEDMENINTWSRLKTICNRFLQSDDSYTSIRKVTVAALNEIDEMITSSPSSSLLRRLRIIFSHPLRVVNLQSYMPTTVNTPPSTPSTPTSISSMETDYVNNVDNTKNVNNNNDSSLVEDGDMLQITRNRARSAPAIFRSTTILPKSDDSDYPISSPPSPAKVTFCTLSPSTPLSSRGSVTPPTPTVPFMDFNQTSTLSTPLNTLQIKSQPQPIPVNRRGSSRSALTYSFESAEGRSLMGSIDTVSGTPSSDDITPTSRCRSSNPNRHRSYTAHTARKTLYIDSYLCRICEGRVRGDLQVHADLCVMYKHCQFSFIACDMELKRLFRIVTRCVREARHVLCPCPEVIHTDESTKHSLTSAVSSDNMDENEDVTGHDLCEAINPNVETISELKILEQVRMSIYKSYVMTRHIPFNALCTNYEFDSNGLRTHLNRLVTELQLCQSTGGSGHSVWCFTERVMETLVTRNDKLVEGYSYCQKLSIDDDHVPKIRYYPRGMSIREFEFLKPITRGGQGKVFLARKIATRDIFAIKRMDKREIVRKNMQKRILCEKAILSQLPNNPFIVPMYFSFTDRNHLYLVLEYMPGGDLMSLLSENVFSEASSRHYLAEIVLAVEYLHSRGIVHRDIKPDNILVGRDGHLKLADFGLSRVGMVEKLENIALESVEKRSFSGVVGTPDYMAPEIIAGKPNGFPVDLWALGVLLYEFRVGLPPFHDDDPQLIFQQILWSEPDPLEMGRLYIHEADLIRQLLTKLPEKRIDIGGVKKHLYFGDIDWNHILQHPPPNVPNFPSSDPLDTSCFDARNRVFMTSISTPFSDGTTASSYSPTESDDGSMWDTDDYFPGFFHTSTLNLANLTLQSAALAQDKSKQ